MGNTEWLAARALLEPDIYRTVQRDAERWITNPQRDGSLSNSGTWVWELELDWEGWVADVDTRGRGRSGGEYQLFELTAGPLTGRPFNGVGVLDRMGSREVEAWRILTEWGTGRDNRGRPGRWTALPTTVVGDLVEVAGRA